MTRKLIAAVVAMILGSTSAYCATTMNTTNKWAWSSGSGWINCRADPTNGAVIGEYICWGYLWSSSAGWISLGDGTPTNGIRYTNISSNDYGVNHTGNGKLRGYAWSASAGWINFEDTGAPVIDLRTGIIDGFAWGGSLGWISFTNLQGFTQADAMTNGVDSDADGMPDAWERETTGGTGLAPSSDSDGDGVAASNEYYAGTSPGDSNSFLHIVALRYDGTNTTVTWTSTNARNYRVQENLELTNTAGWTDAGAGLLSPDSSNSTTRAISDPSETQKHYRVRAVYPLSE